MFARKGPALLTDMPTLNESLPILLVEDSPADRARLEPILPGATVALDADSALAAVRQHSFAAILIAEDLAGRSGLDLLRELRASGDRTPVILLTPEGHEPPTETALRAGALGCLAKEAGFEASLPGLLERAAASVPGRATHAGGVVTFELGGHLHGLFAEDVELVAQAVAVMPLPGAPPGVEGLVDVQGRLVPVFDLRARLGLPASALDPDEDMVVARIDGRLVAIRVDRTVALARIDPSALAIDAPLPAGVAAVTRIDGELVAIHDPRGFLSAATWGTLEASSARESTR